MPQLDTANADDLDEAIRRFINDGYRLDMIRPADSPREALVSKDGKRIRLVGGVQRKSKPQQWVTGRAGMMYRDLIPDRLDGKLIASHIRIIDGGKVKDSVHYHKIDFQLIYCISGAIRVVYEDQGEPLWLQPGDIVLQPPEIRHRVLEAEAGSEVIELSSPADHETWFDNELELPNGIGPKMKFVGQRFVHARNSDDHWSPSRVAGICEKATVIEDASGGSIAARLLRRDSGGPDVAEIDRNAGEIICLIGVHGIAIRSQSLI